MSRSIPSPLVDWQTLVLLTQRRAGLTQDRLGRAVDSDWRHIGRLARGEVREPRWGTGVRLLDLAADHLDVTDWARVKR